MFDYFCQAMPKWSRNMMTIQHLAVFLIGKSWPVVIWRPYMDHLYHTYVNYQMDPDAIMIFPQTPGDFRDFLKYLMVHQRIVPYKPSISSILRSQVRKPPYYAERSSWGVRQGRTPLHRAAMLGRFEVTLGLLQEVDAPTFRYIGWGWIQYVDMWISCG